MQEVIVDLLISTDQYLKRYHNPGAIVHTTSVDGRSVQFPASILQPYLLHSGIKGRFRISFTNAGKFQGIDRLA